MDPVVWSADEAAERLTGPTADLDAGVLRGVPAVVVDDAHLLPADALDPLALLPLVCIGVVASGANAPGFDAVAPDLATGRLLAGAVHDRPNAATTLAQVLRASEGQATEAALLLEATAYATLLGGGQRPTPRFICKVENRVSELFNRPAAFFPAFSPESAPKTLSGILSGYSIARFDHWNIYLREDRIVILWIGFDKPQRLQLTRELTDLLETLTF